MERMDGEVTSLEDRLVSRDIYGRALGLLLTAVADAQARGDLLAEPPGDPAFVIWAFCLGYWENHRTRRGFDGRVPLAEAGWPRVRRHFLRSLRVVLRGLRA